MLWLPKNHFIGRWDARMTEVDFYEESVPVLRYRLWQLGLDHKGTKNDLIQRLVSVPTQQQCKSLQEALHTVVENSLERKNGEKTCEGMLLHHSVWITQREHMRELGSTLSGFGKGSLSRSIPVFGTDAPEALRGKAARQRAKLSRKKQSLEKEGAFESFQQTSFSPYATESLAVDISLVLSSSARDDPPFEEHLQLCLWEAFYASFVTNQLRILDNSNVMSELSDPDHTYAYFSSLIPHFPYYLAVYCYFKEKGWSPHSGLKYGVDFVLYYGSAESHVHSPFCVLVDIDKGDSFDKSLLEKSWISLQNRLRLVKQVAKQLLLVRVQKPKWLTEEMLFSQRTSCLSLEISELLVERWTAQNKRRKKDERD